jgi:putative transposase
MPRQPRYFLAGMPLHVIQRGNNRQPTFCSEDDFTRYRSDLLDAADRNRLAIHAYVLMPNHVHLLVTPEFPSSLPKTMQAVGRRFVPYFNAQYSRTGTLWEGRYRATAIEDERYLLTCMRYVELNPVRADLVKAPAEYAYSSHRANAWGVDDALICPHALLIALGATAAERGASYRALFNDALPQATLDAIRDATNKGWALGVKSFHDRIERATERRCAPLPRGRPRGRKSSPTLILA